MFNCLIFGEEKYCKNYYDFYTDLNTKITVNNCNFYGDYDFAVLMGGGDVNPVFYGGNTASENVDTLRDEREFTLLDYFCNKKKLVIGTCRGLQIANVYFGGTLSNIIETDVIHSQINGRDSYHKLITNASSPFFNELKSTKIVNSAHHQKIEKSAESIIPIAFSRDDVIEVAIHKYLPLFLTQFHPERPLYNNGLWGKSLIKSVLDYYL